MPIDSTEGFKGCGALDDGEEEAQVVASTGIRGDEVHSSESEAALTKSPFLLLLLPDEMLRELLVCVLTRNIGERGVPVRFKESCEHGALASSALLNDFWVLGRVESDQMLARKVDLQAHNVRELFVQVKVEQSPDRFRSSDITTVDELLDLVVHAELDCASVVALVYILADVLQGCERDRTLHIDMAVVPHQKVRVVWHNPPVVDQVLPDLVCTAVVWSVVERIALAL